MSFIVDHGKCRGQFALTATNQVGYLNCRHHLSALDRAVAGGTMVWPKSWDPLLQILWERGEIHEENYAEHLSSLAWASPGSRASTSPERP